jgi:hypothetical protein
MFTVTVTRTLFIPKVPNQFVMLSENLAEAKQQIYKDIVESIDNFYHVLGTSGDALARAWVESIKENALNSILGELENIYWSTVVTEQS